MRYLIALQFCADSMARSLGISQYQSQVHDLLAMKNNCVSVEATDAGPGKKKTHDLDVNEPFFGENALLEFPRVAGECST